MPSTLNEQSSPQVSAPAAEGSGRSRESRKSSTVATAPADSSRESAPKIRLEAARERLRVALDSLGAAVSRQNELALAQSDQRTEYAVMQEDRSRLAVELDAAVQRARALESANVEASRRLERASAAVRAVLDADTTLERSADAGATAKDSRERSADAGATAKDSPGDA